MLVFTIWNECIVFPCININFINNKPLRRHADFNRRNHPQVPHPSPRTQAKVLKEVHSRWVQENLWRADWKIVQCTWWFIKILSSADFHNEEQSIYLKKTNKNRYIDILVCTHFTLLRPPQPRHMQQLRQLLLQRQSHEIHRRRQRLRNFRPSPHSRRRTRILGNGLRKKCQVHHHVMQFPWPKARCNSFDMLETILTVLARPRKTV